MKIDVVKNQDIITNNNKRITMKAMKLSTIILLALSIAIGAIGCAETSKDNILYEVDEVQFQNQLLSLQGQDNDPAFLNYTQEYEFFKGSPINSDVRIFFTDVFDDLPSNHYWMSNQGVCLSLIIFDYGFKLILINRKVWFSLSLSEIESMNHAHLDRYVNEDISYKYIPRDEPDPGLTKQINDYKKLSDKDKKGNNRRYETGRVRTYTHKKNPNKRLEKERYFYSMS